MIANMSTLANPAQPWRPTYSTWIPPDVWKQHEDYIRGLYAGGAPHDRMAVMLALERDFRPSYVP